MTFVVNDPSNLFLVIVSLHVKPIGIIFWIVEVEAAYAHSSI